jgi:hypothetical protein
MSPRLYYPRGCVIKLRPMMCAAWVQTLRASRFDSRATHARTLLPAALASVPFGFVLVRVRVQGFCEPQWARQVTPGNVKVKQTTWGIDVTWCPNLVHHFIRRIPEARWRETVRARSDISTLAMMFSLVFEFSRQKTSITSHEEERLTCCALLPAPCSPCSRSRFRVFFSGWKRRRRDPPRKLGDADRHTRCQV